MSSNPTGGNILFYARLCTAILHYDIPAQPKSNYVCSLKKSAQDLKRFIQMLHMLVLKQARPQSKTPSPSVNPNLIPLITGLFWSLSLISSNKHLLFKSIKIFCHPITQKKGGPFLTSGGCCPVLVRSP